MLRSPRRPVRVTDGAGQRRETSCGRMGPLTSASESRRALEGVGFGLVRLPGKGCRPLPLCTCVSEAKGSISSSQFSRLLGGRRTLLAREYTSLLLDLDQAALLAKDGRGDEIVALGAVHRSREGVDAWSRELEYQHLSFAGGSENWGQTEGVRELAAVLEDVVALAMRPAQAPDERAAEAGGRSAEHLVAASARRRLDLQVAHGAEPQPSAVAVGEQRNKIRRTYCCLLLALAGGQPFSDGPLDDLSVAVEHPPALITGGQELRQVLALLRWCPTVGPGEY